MEYTTDSLIVINGVSSGVRAAVWIGSFVVAASLMWAYAVGSMRPSIEMRGGDAE